MHNDEVKMNVEHDVFAADKSVDNVHSEDVLPEEGNDVQEVTISKI